MISYLMLLIFVLILCETYNMWLHTKTISELIDLMEGILDELENIKGKMEDVKND